MKTILAAVAMLAICLAATSIAFSADARRSVGSARTNLVNWLTEKLWQMEMEAQGLKRNEDAGGVYWSESSNQRRNDDGR